MHKQLRSIANNTTLQNENATAAYSAGILLFALATAATDSTPGGEGAAANDNAPPFISTSDHVASSNNSTPSSSFHMLPTNDYMEQLERR